MLKTTIKIMVLLMDLTAHASATTSVILTDIPILKKLLVLTMFKMLKTIGIFLEKLKDVTADVTQKLTLMKVFLTQPHSGHLTVVLLLKTAME